MEKKTYELSNNEILVLFCILDCLRVDNKRIEKFKESFPNIKIKTIENARKAYRSLMSQHYKK